MDEVAGQPGKDLILMSFAALAMALRHGELMTELGIVPSIFLVGIPGSCKTITLKLCKAVLGKRQWRNGYTWPFVWFKGQLQFTDKASSSQALFRQGAIIKWLDDPKGLATYSEAINTSSAQAKTSSVKHGTERSSGIIFGTTNTV